MALALCLPARSTSRVSNPKVKEHNATMDGGENRPFRPQIFAIIVIMGGIAGALIAIIWFPPLILPKEAWAVIGVVLNGLSMLGIQIIQLERKDREFGEIIRELLRDRERRNDSTDRR